MRCWDYIAVLSVTFIIAVFGYPGQLTEEEKQAVQPANENFNTTYDNTYIDNPENSPNSDDLGTPVAEITTSDNDTESNDLGKLDVDVMTLNNDTKTNDADTPDIDTRASDNETESMYPDADINTSGNDTEYGYTDNDDLNAEEVTETDKPITAVTPNIGGDSSEEYQQRTRDMIETEEQRQERRRKRKDYAGKCVYTKHVRIEDEFGCEMCTCIYEKSMMLCSPFVCQQHPELGEQLNTDTYNDYILGVETHFSEYTCEHGDIVEANAICVCSCIQRNILSCPAACPIGRPLN